MAVYIACSTLCFGKYPFEQALKSINELQFQKIDLAIHESGPHFKPSEIAADVNRYATYLRSTGISFVAFHVEIDAPNFEQYKEQLRAVCRLGRLMTVPVITIPAALAEAEGVILAVETHQETVAADAAGALTLCQRVRGLGLTLDPSHYVVGPHANDDYEQLYPYVRHVRLRDSSAEQMQVRIGQGDIEYGKIVTLLEREGYERALTVDIHDLPPRDYAIEPEARKLKFLLESMV